MRFVLNLLIATGLLLAFNAFGWLTLTSDGANVDFGHMTWSVFGSVLLVAVVVWLSSIIVGLIFALVAIGTLGLGLLAAPFLGWFVLNTTAHFMPGSLSVHGFWITLLCGFLLLVVKIGSPSKS